MSGHIVRLGQVMQLCMPFLGPVGVWKFQQDHASAVLPATAISKVIWIAGARQYLPTHPSN